MKIHSILIGILCTFCCNVVWAQTSEVDYDAKIKNEISIQNSLYDELEVLEKENKELRNSFDKKEGERKKKNDKKENLEKKIKKIKESDSYKRLMTLKQKKDELVAESRALSSRNQDLSRQISQKDDNIAQLSGDVNELNAIKADVCKQLLDEYRPTLQKPFSALTIEELDDIIKECNKYSDNSQIKSMIQQTRNLKGYKMTYDEAVSITQRRYNKTDLDRILRSLSNIKEISSAQNSDIVQVTSVLKHFNPGMETFKAIIVKLNDCREGVTSYSKDDLKDDLDRIRRGAQNDINIYIDSVPYLKTQFDNYILELNANPMGHPAIEREILNYSN